MTVKQDIETIATGCKEREKDITIDFTLSL